jgi:hypothetical protein
VSSFFYPALLLGGKGDMSPWNRRRPRLGVKGTKEGSGGIEGKRRSRNIVKSRFRKEEIRYYTNFHTQSRGYLAMFNTWKKVTRKQI